MPALNFGELFQIPFEESGAFQRLPPAVTIYANIAGWEKLGEIVGDHLGSWGDTHSADVSAMFGRALRKYLKTSDRNLPYWEDWVVFLEESGGFEVG